MMPAIPWPPPTQAVTIPYFLFSRFISFNIWTISVHHKYGVISSSLNIYPGSGNRIFLWGFQFILSILWRRRRKVTNFNYYDMAVQKVIFVSLCIGRKGVSVLAYWRRRGLNWPINRILRLLNAVDYVCW